MPAEEHHLGVAAAHREGRQCPGAGVQAPSGEESCLHLKTKHSCKSRVCGRGVGSISHSRVQKYPSTVPVGGGAVQRKVSWVSVQLANLGQSQDCTRVSLALRTGPESIIPVSTH